MTFKAGHPVVGESLESAIDSSEYDQTVWLRGDIDALEAQPRFRLEIAGYAEVNECAGQECYALSERRAKLEYDWLLDHGAPNKCLVGFKGRGTDEPLYRSGEEEEIQRNRRAEVRSLKVAED